MKEVQEWKLQYMAEYIFRNLTQNPDNRKQLFERLMKGVDIEAHSEIKIQERINKLKQLIEKETEKLDRLIDTYLDKTIDLNMYDMFQLKQRRTNIKYIKTS